MPPELTAEQQDWFSNMDSFGEKYLALLDEARRRHAEYTLNNYGQLDDADIQTVFPKLSQGAMFAAVNGLNGFIASAGDLGAGNNYEAWIRFLG